MLQFRLQTLLLLFVVAWSSLAVFGMGGIVVFALVVGLAVYIHCIKSFWSLLNLALVVVCLLCLIALLLPAVSSARDAARRMVCTNNLRQIALALHNYHDTYKCFPPAYVADKNGKPMHSWRVLILPFIEEMALYKQYNFNEPWDGPNNKKLLASRPSDYSCPSDQQSHTPGATNTNYVAVVGKEAAWAGEKSRSLDPADLGGKTSRTIMLVEVAGTNIQWTEPRDLSLDSLQTANATTPVLIFSSNHGYDRSTFFYTCTARSTCANVAMADGGVSFLWANPNATDQLRSLLKIGGYNDSEPYGPYREAFYYDPGPSSEEWEFNWGNCIALAIWLVSVGLLLYRAVRSRKDRMRSVAEAAQ
jgi:hypothetical protein